MTVPTYRTKSVAGPGMGPEYSLACEHCGEIVGPARSAARWTGLTAGRAAAMWPELRARIQRHAAECPALGG